MTNRLKPKPVGVPEQDILIPYQLLNVFGNDVLIKNISFVCKLCFYVIYLYIGMHRSAFFTSDTDTDI